MKKQKLYLEWVEVNDLERLLNNLPPSLVAELGRTEAKRALLRLKVMEEAHAISIADKKTSPTRRAPSKRG